MKYYQQYQHLLKDIEYEEDLRRNFGNIDDEDPFSGRYSVRNQKRLVEIWHQHVTDKYEGTKKTNNVLGKFARKYDLPLKEFICIAKLIEDSDEVMFFRRHGKDDVFRDCNVRFESSRLKKHKLVFKLVDPENPIKYRYVVSYRTQLELLNKKYAEEYEQMDMALEEEAKRSSLDGLDSLYYVTIPKIGFDGLVVDNALKQSLLAAKARATKHEQIFKKWGLGRVIEYGRGTTLNFRGPPGTGKTLAANCLAKELDMKLLIVRYDQLQSCWVGQTEKHIQNVFKLAKTKNAVLFFDEADAIALDRSSLEKSWEMSQVNTLLKELERFEGVCIFATNFAQKYDKAFERRLTMHIDFKLPTKEQGAIILDKLLPKKSRENKLSLEGLELEGLSGGDIKNVVLNAAGLAARDNAEKIGRNHLREAVTSVKCKKTVDKRATGYIA